MSLLLALLLTAAPAFDGVVPPGAKAEVLVTFDAKAPPELARIAIDHSGRAIFAGTAAFIPLGLGAEKAFRVGELERIDAFAFTPKGVLLVISGRRFGVVGAGKFRALAELPADGMRVLSSGPDDALLFGGKDLFRYRKGGKLEKLISSPELIDAAASDGERVLVSSAGAVLEVGAQSKRLMLAGKKITSLALAPKGGFFYATDTEVGYGAEGFRTPFIVSRSARVQVVNDALHVMSPQLGVVRITPISAFAALMEKQW